MYFFFICSGEYFVPWATAMECSFIKEGWLENAGGGVQKVTYFLNVPGTPEDGCLFWSTIKWSWHFFTVYQVKWIMCESANLLDTLIQLQRYLSAIWIHFFFHMEKMTFQLSGLSPPCCPKVILWLGIDRIHAGAWGPIKNFNCEMWS